MPLKNFGFLSGTGIHHTHIIPGNSERFKQNDRVWPDAAQLSNRDGVITRLDLNGLKVHGVADTQPQAKQAEWTLVF